MKPNQEYIINSLVNQNAKLSYELAQKDAIIAEQQQELEKLQKEKIEEMDAE